MVRLAWIALPFLVVGCTGDIDSEQEQGLTPEQIRAQNAWLDKALPVFKGATCMSCHDGSMEPTAPGFLAGMTDLKRRDTLLAFVPEVVNLSAGQSSRVITKGAHEGPALSVQQASDLLAWISAQRDATPPMTIDLPAYTMTAGMNSIDLSMYAAGASIDFMASDVSGSLYLQNLQVKVGADGLYAVHPLFVTTPAGGMPKPDPIDRYFSVSLNLMANAAATKIGDGTATFNGFSIADPLTIKFDKLAKYTPGM